MGKTFVFLPILSAHFRDKNMQLIIAHARLPDFDTFTILPSIPNMNTH